MNPFDHTDQEFPERFASAFASPSELLAPDEELTSFTWPVDQVPTAVAVDEVAPDRDVEDRRELIAILDDVAPERIGRSDWDALASIGPEVIEVPERAI